MKHAYRYLLTLSITCWLAVVSDAGGQCQSSVLVSPGTNEPLASYTVSISTTDFHCLAGGSFNLSTMPPSAVMFENGIDSFFDIFLEVSTDHFVRDVELTPLMPPGMPFQMLTTVTYDDPWYLPQTLVEEVWVNPMNGRFEYHRTASPPTNVPPIMSPGESFCFVVIHQVYQIPLMVPPGMGQPTFAISPGCTPTDPCIDPMACTPGGPYDYRADVIYSSGQWVLEFEYSNPMIEPACYCVTYTGNLPLNFDPAPLLGLDERTQEFTLSVASLGGQPVCGSVEVFSYPVGLQIDAPPLPWFMSLGDGGVILDGSIGRGAFLPGETVSLVAYLNYSDMCGDANDQWVIENLRVTSEGLLVVDDVGGQCLPGSVHVPASMNYGEAQCIEVCHDVYYIQLNAPPDATPSVTITPGCDPPCAPIEPCTPGAPENCVYWVERIGSNWYLRFEYSNPNIEPVCYCVHYNGLVLNPPQGSVLAAFNEQTQLLNVSLWNSQPMIPVSGTLTLTQTPACTPPPWVWVESFFDVFTVPHRWELPSGPLCHAPGEAFLLQLEIAFDNPAAAPLSYSESVIVGMDGLLHPFDDPAQPCTGDIVPPLMVQGQSACFIVCHNIYDVLLDCPPQMTPVIQVVSGCVPPQCPPIACTPGGPTDYVYETYFDGVQWHLRFEYSNPFIEPVCYCVTYQGCIPTCTPRLLACVDEQLQTFDVSLLISSPEGMQCVQSGVIHLFSDPPGAFFGSSVFEFNYTGAEWLTVSTPVAAGSFVPDSFFDIFAYVDFTEPAREDVWYRNPTHVSPDAADPRLENVDEGGECTGENVPPYGLSPGSSWCMTVCHDIYHIPVYAPPELRPIIAISPGCYGPEVDQCEVWECMPGGPYDYRWKLNWDPDNFAWDLEFEYSNQIAEPACYCLTVSVAPCSSVTNLIIHYEPSPEGDPDVFLTWRAPQMGLYVIYSTINPDHTTLPPSSEWIQEGSLWVPVAGDAMWSTTMDNAQYKNYVVIADCSPPTR